MKTVSKSKTFQKGDDCIDEILDFTVANIETHDYTPKGADWSGGEPSPFDHRCDLKFKYIITVTKIIEGIES